MDLAELKKKAQEGRLSWHEFGDKSFQIKRPTQLDLIELSGKKTGAHTMLETADAYVADWKGFTPADFDLEGDEAVPFDKDLLKIYLEDNFKLANDLLNKVWELVKGFEKEKKTSPPTSTSP